MFFPGHLCLLKDSLTAGMEYTQTKGSQLPPASVMVLLLRITCEMY